MTDDLINRLFLLLLKWNTHAALGWDGLRW